VKLEPGEGSGLVEVPAPERVPVMALVVPRKKQAPATLLAPVLLRLAGFSSW